MNDCVVTDVDYCKLNHCENDGTCEPEENGFTCRCLDGFVGEHCESKSTPGGRVGSGNIGTGDGDGGGVSGRGIHCILT